MRTNDQANHAHVDYTKRPRDIFLSNFFILSSNCIYRNAVIDGHAQRRLYKIFSQYVSFSLTHDVHTASIDGLKVS